MTESLLLLSATSLLRFALSLLSFRLSFLSHFQVLKFALSDRLHQYFQFHSIDEEIRDVHSTFLSFKTSNLLSSTTHTSSFQLRAVLGSHVHVDVRTDMRRRYVSRRLQDLILFVRLSEGHITYAGLTSFFKMESFGFIGIVELHVFAHRGAFVVSFTILEIAISKRPFVKDTTKAPR